VCAAVDDKVLQARKLTRSRYPLPLRCRFHFTGICASEEFQSKIYGPNPIPEEIYLSDLTRG